MGRFQGFDSPLGGLKPIVYADWTASGRQLHFIEVGDVGDKDGWMGQGMGQNTGALH